MSEKSSSPIVRTLAGSMEQALLRWKGSAASLFQKGTVALTIASLPGMTGCGDDASGLEGGGEEEAPDRDGLAWLREQGARDHGMVTYADSYWYHYRECGNRGGCQSVDVFLKLRVREVAGADLGRKRVGVVFRSPASPPRTALGTHFTTLGDGWEEWHVRVSLRAWEPHAFLFSAWYQDGAGHTFYDDNDGQQHVLAYDGTHSVIRQDWSATSVSLDRTGVRGAITVVLADLDPEKLLRMVWTTDGWRTVNEFSMGRQGETNAWYPLRQAGGTDVWQIDLDVPGRYERFQYAIVYRHGLRTGARSYEFWDNNGGDNYCVVAHE